MARITDPPVPSATFVPAGGTAVTPVTGPIAPRSGDPSYDILAYAQGVTIWDGASHPLSATFATLAAAQVVFPFATALTNEMAWAAATAAITAANFNGKVTMPGTVRGTTAQYVMNQQLVITCNFEADAKAQILWTGAQGTPAIALGDPVAALGKLSGNGVLWHHEVWLPELYQQGNFYSVAANVVTLGTDVGVLLTNVNHCRLWFRRINNFSYGMRWTGDDACAWNKVFLDDITDCPIGIHVTMLATGPGGFMNENTFYDGSVSLPSQPGTTRITGTKSLYVQNTGISRPNNNRFIGTSWESGNVEYVIDTAGRDFTHIANRWESHYSVGGIQVNHQAGAINNTYLSGFNLYGVVFSGADLPMLFGDGNIGSGSELANVGTLQVATNKVVLSPNGAIDSSLGFHVNGAHGVSLDGGVNIAPATATGTMIADATNQKLGFWGTVPVVQQVLATGAGHTVDDVIALLKLLGLCRQA